MNRNDRNPIRNIDIDDGGIIDLLKILQDEVLGDGYTLQAKVIKSSMAKYALEQGFGGLLYLISQRGYIIERDDDSLESEWSQRVAGDLVRGQLLKKYWPSSVAPPLLIKGADLNERLYEERGFLGGTRSSSDWDLLIPEADYDKVVNEWCKRFGKPLSPRSVRLYGESPYELGFYIEGLLFELHRTICPPFYNQLSSELIYIRSRLYRSSWGQEVLEPSALDRLLIWLINFGKSGGATRLLDWIDLGLILNSVSSLCSPVEVGIQLKERSLQIALNDALTIIMGTPLSDSIDQQYMESIEIDQRCSKRPASTEGDDWQVNPLLNSLYRHLRPLEIKVHQVKYCEPSLRADYIRRALLRTTADAKEKVNL